MKNKLFFLTKVSLNKKIKSIWFYIANAIFLILVIGLLNIESVIKFFGGDFEDNLEILVVDNVDKFDEFKAYFDNISDSVDSLKDTEVNICNKTIEECTDLAKEDDNKILLLLDTGNEDYFTAKVYSKEELGLVTSNIINLVLTEIHTNIALEDYDISQETYSKINTNIVAENIVLGDEDIDSDTIITAIMQIITLPLFMLIIFLLQMIGSEINEEKSTKSMEIIISNVSPKTHFLSKIISANAFAIIQGLLLLIYATIGIYIRYLVNDGNLIGSVSGIIGSINTEVDLVEIVSAILKIVPILLIMTVLTFFAYSLLAGILASMTTNMEDYQQLQTPMVIVSLVGYYLSIMAYMFKGSLFIKIMSYIPFTSSLLAPTLYVMGDISIIDLLISIVLLIGTILLLIKYGLRIYKVGILNYSGSNLWKKIFDATRRK